MALKACPECSKEISDQAASCPHCGFVQTKPVTPKTGTSLGCGVIMFVVAIIAIIGIIAGGQGANRDVVSSLLAKQDQCRTNLRSLQDLGVGVRRHDGNTDATVDEFIWEALDHDDKIKQALLVYCADMPPSGIYTVYVWGRKSGKILASVTNGNYFDN
jgi:hypothetical protein